MTSERRGEIAYLYLKNKLRNEGVFLAPDIHELIQETATQINIPVEEARQFAEELVRTLVDETFAEETKA